MSNKALVLIIATIFAGLRPNLDAAMIPNVSVSAFSSEFTNGVDQRRATNLVFSTGLFGDFHTTVPAGDMWLTSPTTTGAYTNAFVTFDLGSVHMLGAMKVWNYNETGTSTQRGIQSAHISTAGDDQVFTTNFPSVLFNRAPGAFSNFSQTISLTNVQARYVRLNVLTNWYTSGAAENRVGLSKVQFIDDTVPPTVLFASRNFSNNRVTVHFSETVLASTATNLVNYSISDGTNNVSIQSATMESYANIIYLQTSTLNSNMAYTISVQNVRDAANVISIANSQHAIEPELVLWLKADVGVTADGGGLVSEWADQSGNANKALQSDPVYQPTLVPNALNGKPVLHFNGATNITNYLEVSHTTSLLIRRDLTIYAVVRAQDFTNFNAILTKTLINQPAPFDFYLVSGNGLPRLYRGNGSANALVQGITNFPPGTDVTNFFIISASDSGTNGTQYRNGGFNGTASVTAGVADAGKSIRIGSRDDFVTRMRGDIAEIILIRGALSVAERNSIETYLGTKYGIQLAPPVETVSLNAKLSGTNLALSWPIPTSNAALESSADLAPLSWTTVTNATVITGMTNNLSLAATNAQRFYRLHGQ